MQQVQAPQAHFILALTYLYDPVSVALAYLTEPSLTTHTTAVSTKYEGSAGPTSAETEPEQGKIRYKRMRHRLIERSTRGDAPLWDQCHKATGFQPIPIRVPFPAADRCQTAEEGNVAALGIKHARAPCAISETESLWIFDIWGGKYWIMLIFPVSPERKLTSPQSLWLIFAFAHTLPGSPAEAAARATVISSLKAMVLSRSQKLSDASSSSPATNTHLGAQRRAKEFVESTCGWLDVVHGNYGLKWFNYSWLHMPYNYILDTTV